MRAWSVLNRCTYRMQIGQSSSDISCRSDTIGPTEHPLLIINELFQSAARHVFRDNMKILSFDHHADESENVWVIHLS